MEISKEDEEASVGGDKVTNDKPSTCTSSDGNVSENQSDAGGDVGAEGGSIDPVPCPEPKSGAIGSTPSVTAKSKQQIEEEEREKMQ